MTVQRIPLVPSINTRNASTAKDAVGFNCMYETGHNGKRVIKRPGLYQLPISPAIPAGEGQGLFSWNNYLVVGQTNSLYGVSGNTSTNFGSVVGTVQPFSFTQTANDTYLVFHNGANLYTVTKTGLTVQQAVAGSVVGNVSITSQGSGYATTPSVTFSAPPSGTTATGNAVVQNGKVTAITVTNGGTGYVTPPTITIATPTATTSTATITTNLSHPVAYTGTAAGVTAYQIDSLNIISAGAGYIDGSKVKVVLNLTVGGVPQTGNTNLVIAYGTVVNSVITSWTMLLQGWYLYYTGTDTLGQAWVTTLTVDAPPSASLSTATASASMVTAITGPYAYGIAYLNSRVFIMTTAGVIYQSAIDNPTSWNPADFIAANSDPDQGVALIRHLNYLVAFGQWSTDFFYDAGNPTASVLAQYQAAKLEIGCAAGPTVAKAEQTVFWVGQGLTEGRGVYMFEGITPVKISTRYIDRILNNDNLIGTHSYCMKVSGHTLYVLTLLNSNITLVYDLEEKDWYQWTSQSGGVESYFNATYFSSNVEYAPNIYLQNETTGQVYVMSSDYTNDAGNSIYFRIRTPILDFNDARRKFYRKAEIIGDKSPGTLSIRHSDDDYATYSAYRIVTLSDNRPIIYQCGSGRRRSWELFSSDNIPIRLEALEVDVSEGEQA